jgi:uncharacterized ParB-like nuclease family protein
VPCEGSGKPVALAAPPPPPKAADVTTIAVISIRTDGGTQQREALREETVAEYTEAILAGAELPPVIVYDEQSEAHDGVYWLADGFHRLAAYKAAGKDKIRAEVREGTLRDAILFSVGANATHGLRRSNEDKRRAVLTLLKDEVWSKWSDRQIGEASGTTHPFVAKLRRALAGEPEAPPTPPVVTVTTPMPATTLDWPEDADGRIAWIAHCADLDLVNAALRAPGVQVKVVRPLEQARANLEKIERCTALGRIVGDLHYLLGWSWPAAPATSPGILAALLRRVEQLADVEAEAVPTVTEVRETVGTRPAALEMLRRRGLSVEARTELLAIAHLADKLLDQDRNYSLIWKLEEALEKSALPPALHRAVANELQAAREADAAKAKATAPSHYELLEEHQKHPEKIAELEDGRLLRDLCAKPATRTYAIARFEALGITLATCPDPRCGQNLRPPGECTSCWRPPKVAKALWEKAVADARAVLALAGESDLKTSVLDIVDRIRGGFLVDLEEVAMELQVAAGVEGLTDDGDEGDLDDEGGDEGDDLTDDGDDA